MQVLYKELKTFDQLQGYIQNHKVDQVFSNVAISCAIHDQQLDETMNIEHKTTTNILASDFCKQQEVGKYFKGNQDQFHQMQVVDYLKGHMDLCRSAYDLLEDSVSKDNLFALLMFLLCPYTNRFFAGRLVEGEDLTPTYAGLDYKGFRQKKEEIQAQTKDFTVALGTSLLDFIEIPLLVGKLHPNASITLELYSGERHNYSPILMVEIPVETRAISQDLTKKRDETSANPCEKIPVEQSVETEIAEKFEAGKEENTVKSEENVVKLVEEPVEQSEELEEDESEPTSTMAADDLATVLASLPQTATATAVSSKKEAPPRITARLDLESLQKSIELLGTMEELVIYLHKQYPTGDPLCAELLNSMLSGVQSIRESLRKHELEF